MKLVRAALALLLVFAVPVRAETTTDPLWYLFASYVVAPDARAASAGGEGAADSKRLAGLQADLILLSEGFEAFRDEAQVKEALIKLEPQITPELRPFFRDRAASLDAVYRTLAVVDYTWALRFPEPTCSPLEARRKLLNGRDGLFQTPAGEASGWLVSLLGPQAKGKSAEQALDEASSKTKLSAADYERRRALVRKLTLALESDKAVGAARVKLYCSRASAFEELAAFQRERNEGAVLASRSASQTAPEQSVFVVVSGSRRSAATLVKTTNGPVLLVDASAIEGDEHPRLLSISPGSKPVEMTVARRDSVLGLAALAYSEDLARPALILASTPAAHHDLVSALGHTSVSGPWTKTSGLVTKTGPESFQTDAAVSADFTGGPVLNGEGEVVGVLVSRPADSEEGRWPIAVTAAALSSWLDGGSVAAPVSESVADEGTAALLSRARPDDPVALEIASLPVAPQGNIVCMKYCEGLSAPSRSYSSYSGGSSYDQGSAELGQAIGKLGAVLILKGIPALFRGIGKLFEKKSSSPAKIVDNRHYTAPAEVKKQAEPPPPPKPACRLAKTDAPATIGAEPIEVAVAVVCDGGKVSLAGHTVVFTFDWAGKQRTVTMSTDAGGTAYAVVWITNEATKVEKVRGASARSHDDLDRYDPDKLNPDEPLGQNQDEFAPAAQPGSREGVQIAAASALAVGKAAEVATAGVEAEEAVAASMAAARAARIASAAGTGEVVALTGSGTVLRVTATLTLSGPAAAAAGVVLTAAAAKQTFDIGWAIGTVAEKKISDIQRGLKAYDKDEKDCIERISDYEITQKGLDPHTIKYEELGKKAEIKRWELCRCKNGEIAVRFKGCTGPTRRTGIFL